MNAKGLSLIELLVVIAIVAILSGLLLPAMIRARIEAHRTADISSIRQVALAGTLYQDRDGQFPLRVEQLVAGNLVPAQICMLRLDPMPRGVGNHVLVVLTQLDHLAKTEPPYPQSFVTPGTYGYSASALAQMLTSPNSGWAFATLEADRGEGSGPLFYGKSYYRLRADGSVQRRATPLVPIENNGVSLTHEDFFHESAS